jgi:hypothetical protein
MSKEEQIEILTDECIRLGHELADTIVCKRILRGLVKTLGLTAADLRRAERVGEADETRLN